MPGFLSAPHFDGCFAGENEQPVPTREGCHNDAEDGVEDGDEIHHGPVLFERVMVPQGDYSDHHVHTAHHKVHREQ